MINKVGAIRFIVIYLLRFFLLAAIGIFLVLRVNNIGFLVMILSAGQLVSAVIEIFTGDIKVTGTKIEIKTVFTKRERNANFLGIDDIRVKRRHFWVITNEWGKVFCFSKSNFTHLKKLILAAAKTNISVAEFEKRVQPHVPQLR